MTETATTGTPADAEKSRRDFLLVTTSTVGVVGTALAAWPFIDSMNPAADVRALSSTDVDITPSADADNLALLADALVDLDANLRVENEPDGVPFDRSAEALAGATTWNLVTRHGALDLTLAPSGTTGFDDLRRDAVEIIIRETRVVVASLADIIRSKEAANREKDRLTLPTLRRILEEESNG